MLEGSFFAYIPRPQPWLLGALVRSKSEKLVEEKLDPLFQRYSENLQQELVSEDGAFAKLSRGSSPLSSRQIEKSQVKKYVFPAGGIAVQPGISNYAAELVHIYPYVKEDKERVLVFFGHLSNLDELLMRSHEWGKGSRTLDFSSEDVGSATTTVIMGLYDKLYNQEILLLSELQGQYAFVVFDNNRKQVFAARDPSGGEHLYYHVDEQGSVSFTNTLNDLPPSVNHHDWRELSPGHYISGKVPTLHQFALTPEQLMLRERHESLESPHMLDADPPSGMSDAVGGRLSRSSRVLV